MVAGQSAGDQASRAALRAAELGRRAEAARKRSEAFAKGEEGERLVANALAPLSAAGCHILHDRFATTLGGNIDHLVIGPGGVLVINAKHWKDPPVVKDGVLWCRGRRQTELVTRMRNEASVVNDVLVACGITTTVTPVLVFTAPGLDSHAPTVDGCKVLTPGHLRRFASVSPVLSVKEMDHALEAVVRSLPPASEGPRPPELDVFDAEARRRGLPTSEELTDLYSRLYVTEWNRGSARRLYIHAAGGVEVGSKDLASGQVTIEGEFNKDAFTKALLGASRSADLKKVKLPELYAGDPATWSRAKHIVANRKVELLVGWRWRRPGSDRLYVHRLAHKSATIELGYVDLVKGLCVPTDLNDVGRKGTSPEHLLTWSWMGWHTASTS